VFVTSRISLGVASGFRLVRFGARSVSAYELIVSIEFQFTYIYVNIQFICISIYTPANFRLTCLFI
jgi:hypothetical protein